MARREKAALVPIAVTTTELTQPFSSSAAVLDDGTVTGQLGKSLTTTDEILPAVIPLCPAVVQGK
jgi:hypothetical protein